MNHTNITFEDLYTSFLTRLSSDKRFKNIGSATVFGMFLETLCANTDMTLYNLQRLLEEQFQDTARQDSSHIKIANTRGYQPRRPVPAQTELCITLKGPFPKEFKELDPLTSNPPTFYFNNDIISLKLFNDPFMLSDEYVYNMTDLDIRMCTEPTWRKTLRSANRIKSKNKETYFLRTQTPEEAGYTPIKAFQGEEKTIVFKGEEYISKFTENQPQEYEIPDITFSNWYGRRDPFTNKKMTTVTIKSSDRTTGQPEREIEIEDNAIFLNPDILDDDTKDPNKIHKVCLLETSENKTPVISFTSLKNLAEKGLSYVDYDGDPIPEDLHVTYISTHGASANRTNVQSMKLTHNKGIFITVNNKIVDITNNIEFSLRTNIVGGMDFETQRELDDNSEASYFASMMKVVSKRDLLNWLVTLDKPINVTNALVYNIDGETISNRYMSEYLETLKGMNQNYILYTVTNDMYVSKEGVWYPKYILSDKSSISEEFFTGFISDDENNATLYTDAYEAHVPDYLKFIISPDGFYNQYIKRSDESDQAVYNIRNIYKKIARLVPSNNIVYSLPPFMHYYDLVGTVKVKSATKELDKFKTELQNKIYKYLNDTSNETREIYKSNLIKLCLDNEHVESADLDIKTSGIVSPEFTIYNWYPNNTASVNGITLLTNHNISTTYNLYVKNILTSIYDTDGQVISLKSGDTMNFDFELSSMTNNTISTKISHKSKINATNVMYDGTMYIMITLETPLVANLSSTNIFVNRQLYNNDNTYDVYNVNMRNFTMSSANENNYWTSSKFDTTSTRASDYGLDSQKMESINKDINEWISNLHHHDEADRAIDLPYEVKSYQTVTRLEEIARRGDIITDDENTLSEYSFWNYFAPMIIKKYFPGIRSNTNTDPQNSQWMKASMLIMDIYKLLKPGLSDSILDDNNNITNYSMDQDIAVVRCHFNVEYAEDYTL